VFLLRRRNALKESDAAFGQCSVMRDYLDGLRAEFRLLGGGDERGFEFRKFELVQLKLIEQIAQRFAIRPAHLILQGLTDLSALFPSGRFEVRAAGIGPRAPPGAVPIPFTIAEPAQRLE